MVNKREHVRLDWEKDVELEHQGRRTPGRTLNISRGGAYVQTAAPPSFGSSAILHVDLPGVPAACAIPCIARWVKPGEGVGLQFQTLRPIEVWALNKLLKSLGEPD